MGDLSPTVIPAKAGIPVGERLDVRTAPFIHARARSPWGPSFRWDDEVIQ